MRCFWAMLLLTSLLARATGAAGVARAGNDEVSIEASVGAAQLVVVGVVEGATPTQLTVRVTERLKGTVGERLTLSLPLNTPYSAESGEVLVFAETRDERAGDVSTDVAWYCQQVIRLGDARVLTMDLRRLARRQEIIDAARAEAGRKDVQALRIPIPPPILHAAIPDPPWTSWRWPTGDTRWLIVPADERLFRLGRQWARSPDTYHRALSVHVLSQFREPQTIAILRDLLQDKGFLSASGPGKFKEADYFLVAGAARNLLNRWGEPVPPVSTLNGPVYFHQPMRLRPSWVAFGVALLIAWLTAGSIIARRRTRRFGIQPTVADGIFGSASAAMLLLAASAAFLWVRSLRGTVDEVMFHAGPAHHQIASYRGGLQYVVMRGVPAELPPMYGTFRPVFDSPGTPAFRASLLQPGPQGTQIGPSGPREDWWSLETLQPDRVAQKWGFVLARLATAPPPAVGPPAFRLTRVPCWAVVLLALSVPLASRVRTARMTRRLCDGYCPNCGYDLRESPNRCPECGRAALTPEQTFELTG